jgi:hypothetical protein
MMPAVSPQLHARVRDEPVHEGEDDRHDGIGQEFAEKRQRPRQGDQRVEPLRDRAVLCRRHQTQREPEQDGADDHDAHVLDEAARETARLGDAPHEIETVFDLLNRRDHRVNEKYQADGTGHAAAHILDELHDAGGQLRGRAPQGAEKFVEDQLKIPVRAKAFQNRKAEHHQRHERQQGGVGQAHCPDVDLARQPVANQRRGKSQYTQGGPPWRTHAARFLKQSVF